MSESRFLMHVVGARPNFMKLAPVLRALNSFEQVRQTVVHTGQHYSSDMSDIFFRELGLPEPDMNLGVGSGSHAVQTASIMTAFEKVLEVERPDAVIVYGDVNSTLACSLVCAKAGVPVVHVEAGLRSFDNSMPEEINRIVTDRLARVLLAPSEDGKENLLREGVPVEQITVVGNVMIDTLKHLLPVITDQAQDIRLWNKIGLEPGKPFALVTLHRPAGVDVREILFSLMKALGTLAQSIPVVFPVHPRTRANLANYGVDIPQGVAVLPPLGYVDFLALQMNCSFVVTDSGGVQEESTWLGKPCLTMRENTERPVTVEMGTNQLVGIDPERMLVFAAEILEGNWKEGVVPPLWDGRAGERAAQVIMSGLEAGLHG